MGEKLIIGCGYLGQRIDTLWLAQKHRVFATTRSQTRAIEFKSWGIEPILCDVMDAASLGALPQVDSIVYCIGLDRSAGISMHSLYVHGLANLLAALTQPLPKFLYVSSTSVYGQTDGKEVNENAVTEPHDGSGKIVLEAERLLRSKFPSSIILRFAGIYGPGRLMRSQAIKAGEPMAGDADKWLNLIHVEDGAAAIVAAEDRAVAGALYNISDSAPVRRRHFYTKLAEVMGAPVPQFIPLPAGSIASPRERAQRRIISKRMIEDLGVRLRYPNYHAGLIACV